MLTYVSIILAAVFIRVLLYLLYIIYYITLYILYIVFIVYMIYVFYLMTLSVPEARVSKFQIKVVEKLKTHILYSITFFRKSWCLWHNVKHYGTARQATDDNIIRRMRSACWITMATDTHSEYVILMAFPRQTRLRKRALISRYTYITCLIYIQFITCLVNIPQKPAKNYKYYIIFSSSMKDVII